jgi:hypothetical protein
VDNAAGFHLLGMATQTDAIVRSLRIGKMVYSLSDKSIQVQSIDNPGAEISSLSTVVLDVPKNATGSSITPNPGRQFTGSVAIISGTDPTNLYASISWGDGTSFSYGTITANGDGTFSVIGSHTYLQEGHYSISVSLTNPDGSLQVQGTAVVTRAPDQIPVAPDATGSTFTINYDDSLIDTGVTFTTSDPSKIHAMIDWFGSGSFVEGTIVPNGKGAFTVQKTEPGYYPVFWVGIADVIPYYRLAPGSHDITVILYDGSGLPTVVHSTVIVNAPPPITGGGGGGGCGDDNPPAPPPAVPKVETPAPTPATESSVNFLPPPSQASTVASESAPASTSGLPRPAIITAGLEPATSLNSPAGSGLGSSERGTNGMDSVGPADIGLSETGLKEEPSDGLKEARLLNFDVVLPNWSALRDPLGSSQTDQGGLSEDGTASDFQSTVLMVERLQSSDGALQPAGPGEPAFLRMRLQPESLTTGWERPGNLAWSQEMLGSLLILSLPSWGGQNKESAREEREK